MSFVKSTNSSITKGDIAEIILVVFFCAIFIAGCSSSGSDPDTNDPDTNNPDTNDPNTDNPNTNNPDTNDPNTDNPDTNDPSVQTTTVVMFDIEVPAYQSDALQLSLSWGARDFTAAWVGDEFWTASASLPTDTEQQLTVTFSDNNGDLTLGSVVFNYRTGINSSESFRIGADQFETQQWDDDNDGQSNLDELLAGTPPQSSARVLLFSETRGFRHPSIASALIALQELANSADIQVDLADDSEEVFVEDNLGSYDAVVWVLTSGDVLNNNEQGAFENYIRAGGGYAGIHAASDTEYDWPWYGSLVGAYFERHPEIQSAIQIVEDNTHTSTRHLGSTWVRTDEWYDYQSNPRSAVNVLQTLDENTYRGGGMGEDHPSAWYHEFDGGRSWYTGGGHTIESYDEPDFRSHLLGGMRYAAGLAGF